jgi:hypothetical protein
MEKLLQSVESNLALAKHAETWSWKEGEAKQRGGNGTVGLP